MAAQLTLLTDDRPDFSIDETTKAIGRRGLAEAREVLARSRQPWRLQPDQSIDDSTSSPTPLRVAALSEVAPQASPSSHSDSGVAA